jgi:hypothetical protein
MYPYTDSELDTFCLLQTSIEVSHGIEDTQARAYCSLGIILMRLGIAEVHQESIPKELRNVTLIALNHLSTDALIRTDHVPVLFGVELAGESCGVHEITKQHGELTAFSFW